MNNLPATPLGLIWRLGAAALVGVWALAILSPQHIFPVSSFYQEVAVAAVLLLATAAVVAAGALRSGFSLPWAALAPSGLLVVALLGLLLHRPSYPDALVWPLGSLLVAIIAAWLGHAWGRAGQGERLLRLWLVAFAVAAIGTVAVMWVQIFQPSMVALWLFPRQPLQAPFGNLAQRNQAALVVGFGLLALAYWGRQGVQRATLKRVLTVIGMLWLVAGLTLTQSRIGFGFLFVAGVAFGLLWAPAQRRLLGAVLGVVALFAAYALMQWLIYSAFGLGQLFPPGAQRLLDRGAGQRLGLWAVALQEWRAHPVFGGGFGSYAAWDYHLALEQAQPLFADNAHNLFAQIAAETGTAGLLVVLLALAGSALGMWQSWVRQGLQLWTDWRIPLLGVCAMVAGYSLTEYPLWYVFFSVPFFMAWGALDATLVTLRPSRSVRVLLVALPLAMVSYLGWAAMRYAEVAKLSQAVFMPNTMPMPADELAQRIRVAVNSPGFSPYVEALVFVQMSTDRFMLPDKIALGEGVVATYSSPVLIAKLATLYGLDGQTERAARHFARLCAYFPNDCENAARNIAELKKQYPQQFNPVAKRFFTMPQSKIKPTNVNVLRPWEKHADGTTVTIDPSKTLFGFDLALYASGLAQQGVKGGRFIAAPQTNASK